MPAKYNRIMSPSRKSPSFFFSAIAISPASESSTTFLVRPFFSPSSAAVFFFCGFVFTFFASGVFRLSKLATEEVLFFFNALPALGFVC